MVFVCDKLAYVRLWSLGTGKQGFLEGVGNDALRAYSREGAEGIRWAGILQ